MDRLEVIEKMLSTLLRHEGLMQWIDCFGYGANEGGRYTSLFNSRANFRIVVVYEELFNRLPAYVREQIPTDCGGDISTDRARVEKAGRLIACKPFCIARYGVGSGDDMRWKFSGVLWESSGSDGGRQVETQDDDPPAPPEKAKPQQPARQTQAPSGHAQPRRKREPIFANVGDALDWALGEGAYSDRAAANTAYTQLKREHKPKNAGAMYAIWIGHVSKVAKLRQRQAA